MDTSMANEDQICNNTPGHKDFIEKITLYHAAENVGGECIHSSSVWNENMLQWYNLNHVSSLVCMY